jgi:hypothetical protein
MQNINFGRVLGVLSLMSDERLPKIVSLKGTPTNTKADILHLKMWKLLFPTAGLSYECH